MLLELVTRWHGEAGHLGVVEKRGRIFHRMKTLYFNFMILIYSHLKK